MARLTDEQVLAQMPPARRRARELPRAVAAWYDARARSASAEEEARFLQSEIIRPARG